MRRNYRNIQGESELRNWCMCASKRALYDAKGISAKNQKTAGLREVCEIFPKIEIRFFPGIFHEK